MAAWKRLLSNSDFAKFFAADLTSTLGSQLSIIAYPLLVLAIGGRPAEAGLVGTCSLVTRLVARLPAGHLADMISPRQLMLAADLIRFVAVGSIPLASAVGTLTMPQLLLVGIIEGAASAAFMPTMVGAIRDLVPEADLTAALSGLQSASAATLLTGPALGGWLFSIDRILPFTVDAASYGISALLLFGMTSRLTKHRPSAGQDVRASAGLRWLSHQRQLLLSYVFVGTLNLTAAALPVGLVLVLRRQEISSSRIGLVIGCLGIGSVVGAALARRVLTVLSGGPLLLLTGIVWTAGFVALAFRPPIPMICAVLLVLLLLPPAAGIHLAEAMMRGTPRHLLGRVNTAAGTLTGGLEAFGPLLIGLSLQEAGVAGAWLVLAGIAGIITALVFGPLRRLRSLLPVADPDPATMLTPVPNPSNP